MTVSLCSQIINFLSSMIPCRTRKLEIFKSKNYPRKVKKLVFFGLINSQKIVDYFFLILFVF